MKKPIFQDGKVTREQLDERNRLMGEYHMWLYEKEKKLPEEGVDKDD